MLDAWWMILFVLQPTANQQERLQELVVSLERKVERESGAIRRRLEAHRTFDHCILTKVKALSDQNESAETLFEAALAFCADEDRKLQSRTVEQCEAFRKSPLHECAEKLMDVWKQELKRRAIACVMGRRVEPHRLGLTERARVCDAPA